MSGNYKNRLNQINWSPAADDVAPDRWAGQSPAPCFHCLNGNAHLCTLVDCYRCDCGGHQRRHGTSVAADGPEHGARSTLKGARR